MPIGDGIRRDISKVSEEERARFIDAIGKLDVSKIFPDGVTYWDKQEDIHKNAHFNGVDVHGGPGFIPWHRVIVNRLEGLLREVDPALSLHYWDWTTDPRSTNGGRAALFTDAFMDNSSGEVSHLLKDFESTEGNGHAKIWRDVAGTAANGDGTPALASDATILNHSDFNSFAAALTQAHDFTAHSYIGGTITQAHYSFHDPFVFLLHSNLDRIWARWQTEPGKPERLDPMTAYAGLSPAEISTLAAEMVEPWAGGTGLEPWASDPTKQARITYTDLSVITPPCYDTNQGSFQVVEAENPFNAGTSRYRIKFNDVPEEETTWRAAMLRVRACGDVTIRIKPGFAPAAPFRAVADAVPTHEGPQPFRDIKVWFEYTAGAVGTAPQSAGPANTTLKCDESGEEFEFELIANTIKRPTVAVQLVLDQSGSMSDPAGTSGSTRLQVLKDAAELFAQLIQKDNGVGLIRFDQDAYAPNDPTYPGLAITKVNSNSFGDATRLAALNAIAAHGAHGSTSVGDGVEMGRTLLNALAANAYDQKAMIVLTDGLENEPKSIQDVMPLVDDRTFAIGLGNETQVSTAALAALAGSTNGSLLLTGLLSGSLDDQFRLRKFFLQILAGVTRTSIVRDPAGYLGVGSRVRIPFDLAESDINCRVIALTELPVIRLAVETPDGKVIDQANAGSFGAAFDRAQKVVTSRFGLPVAFQTQKVHAGRWHAVLEIDRDMVKRLSGPRVDALTHDFNPAIEELKSKGARYCVTIHAFSNLRMSATVAQSGFVPGSTVFLRCILSEYGVPLANRARVQARVENPDKSQSTIALTEAEPGGFAASFVAGQTGIYNITFLAEGGTSRGTRFTREQISTAAVWTGGDRPSPSPGSDTGQSIDWCGLLSCLISEKNFGREIQERWRAEGINLQGIRECLKRSCRGRK